MKMDQYFMLLRVCFISSCVVGGMLIWVCLKISLKEKNINAIFLSLNSTSISDQGHKVGLIL